MITLPVSIAPIAEPTLRSQRSSASLPVTAEATMKPIR